MADSSPTDVKFPKRIDLHCHSRASTEADEAVLTAIRCPESYSEPLEIHALAHERGMDFVTITDHDSIAGVSELLHLPNIIVGEELTCYFPEDHCKIHLLLWGIDQADHDALQAVSDDIYIVAEYVASKNLAHAVAHPLYRQNGKLDRWHIERLLLLFRGFECLNGAHSQGHREAFEPMLDDLNEEEIHRLQLLHDIAPLYKNPWHKVRTAGSDDHGMFNIGRTWTEFPEDARTAADVLTCLRNGRCRPGGEAGSSIKLAHNFYGVGMRYHTREITRSLGSIESILMKRLVGEKSGVSKISFACKTIGFVAASAKNKLSRKIGLKKPARGTALLGELVTASARKRIRQSPEIRSALRDGRAALAEHQALFDLISGVSRDVCGGIFSSVSESLNDGKIGSIFDAVSTVLAHQAMLFPYYFALFHQNQERHLLGQMTGRGRRRGDRIRVAVFTDSIHPRQPAGHFVNGLTRFAENRNVEIVVYSSRPDAPASSKHFQNFQPLVSRHIAAMKMDLHLPPVLEILQATDNGQFDVVVANTGGPMGLCGWLVAKMLRAPMLAVCHEDLSRRALGFTGGDYRVSMATRGYADWFYSSAQTLLLRSRSSLETCGVARDKCLTLAPTPRTIVPSPDPFDSFWREKGIGEPLRLICPASLSSRKDVALIASAFQKVCAKRNDVALVLVGDGPLSGAFEQMLMGLPVYRRGDEIDALELCAKADLLVYADRDDVSAQLVIDAQAAGLPVLVSTAGAACEFVEEELTGYIIPGEDSDAWAARILQLLEDEPMRLRLSRTAKQRSQRLAPARAYEQVWEACKRAVIDDPSAPEPSLRRDPQSPINQTISEVTHA